MTHHEKPSGGGGLFGCCGTPETKIILN